MNFSLSNDDLMKFSYTLLRSIRKHGKPIFLCVGSDKYVCDSMAPIVAEILKHEYNINAYVYGGLSYNINANNLVQTVNYIETIHPNDYIVLIDVTLGDNVGEIEIKEGCFAGLGKTMPIMKIGRLSILGVVGRKGKNFNLNSTRLKLVMDLSRFIAKGCFLAVNQLDKELNDKKVCNYTSIKY